VAAQEPAQPVAWTKVQFSNADSNDQNAFNGSNNNFTAPFAGTYVFGFSLRFKANATVPTKAIATFYKNGAELGRGRAVSGALVDDVKTYNLTVFTPLAANDVIDVRVHFATNDGYIESDQSHFRGHYVACRERPLARRLSLVLWIARACNTRECR
jgi:hypothetical protein